MNKDEFIARMIKEYQENVIEPSLRYCETPQFNMLLSLAESGKLYDFFYPLSIGTDRISDVAYVCREIDYAEYDDGDLSIVSAVLAKRDESDSYTMNKIFVMRGSYSELREESVRDHALYHGPENFVMKSYIAKRFSHKALAKIHYLIPRFVEEERLGKDSSLKDTMAYLSFVKKTNKLLVEMVMEL